MGSAIRRLEKVAERVRNPDLDDAVDAVKRAWEQAKPPAATPAVAQRPPEDAPWRPPGA